MVAAPNPSRRKTSCAPCRIASRFLSERLPRQIASASPRLVCLIDLILYQRVSYYETNDGRGMADYTAEALAALVQPGRVHRALYTDPEIFRLEMERIFAGA